MSITWIMVRQEVYYQLHQYSKEYTSDICHKTDEPQQQYTE